MHNNGFKDITGQKFNRWQAEEYIGKNKHKRHVYLFRCDCGNTKVLDRADVVYGKSKSCGCLRKEKKDKNPLRKNCGSKKTYTKLEEIISVRYNIIKQRCYTKKDRSFKYYGGKGIKICDEWLKNKKSFIKWSIENGFKPGLSIDRIDSDKDYSPENCRWITLSENSTKANLKRWHGIDGLDLRGEHGKIT